MKKRLFSLIISLFMVISLVSVLPAVTASADTTGHQAIVLLLDISGSMDDSIGSLKTAALKFCNKLIEADSKNQIAIVTFASYTKSYGFSNDTTKLSENISNLSAYGGTNMSEAFVVANTLLQDANYKNGYTKSIVVMADGEPNDDTSTIENATALFSYYSIYSIGFYPNQSARNLLKSVQNRGYYESNDVDELINKFLKVAKNILNATNTNYKTPNEFNNRTLKKYSFFSSIFNNSDSFAIPGLIKTNLDNANCNRMVPQGLCFVDDKDDKYIIISAYCDKHKNHNSVLYVLNASTHKYITTIILRDNSHVGGIAYDSNNKVVWVAKSFGEGESGISKAIDGISLETISDLAKNGNDANVLSEDSYAKKDLMTGMRVSYLTYYKNMLWIGDWSNSTFAGYKVNKVDSDAKNTLTKATKTTAFPNEVKNSNGMAFYNYNGSTYIGISDSWGRTNSSTMYTYKVDLTDLNNIKFSKKNGQTMPNMSEEIEILNGTAYMNFESASAKYYDDANWWTKLFLYPTDRICSLNAYSLFEKTIKSLAFKEWIYQVVDNIKTGFSTAVISPPTVSVNENEASWQDEVSWMPVEVNNAQNITVSEYSGNNETITVPTQFTQSGNTYCVAGILSKTFEGISGVKTINIPETVTNIETGAISDCPALTTITVNSNNTAYSSSNGILFNKNKTMLIYSPQNNLQVKIPNTVKAIADGAFLGSKISSISIPEGVKEIGDTALMDCMNLKEIIIPKSVETIGAGAIGYYYDRENDADEKVAGFKIYCYEGTAGEEYAIANGFNYVLLKEPANVSGFKSTSTTSSSITLGWNKISDATGYIVYKEINGAWVGVGTPTTNSFTDKNLNSNKTYKYAVRAYKKINNDIKLYSPSLTKLYAYTNIVNVSSFKVTGRTTSSVSLSWEKVNSSISGYIVYREKDGKWVGVGTPETTTYTDKSLNPGTSYKYAIRAYRKINDTIKIYSESMKTLTVSTKIGSVSGIKTTGTTASSVSLGWNKVTGAAGYAVYRLVDDNWKLVGNTTTNSYTDSPLSSNKKYKYGFKAYSKLSNGTTIYSESMPTLWAHTNLINVSAFKVTESKTKSISFSWNAVKDATGYIVYRKIDGSWIGVGTPRTTTFTDSNGLYSGCSYEYAIRAFRNIDDSTKIYSEGLRTLETSTKPVKTTFTLTPGKRKIDISWNKVAGATSYTVFYKETSSGSWNEVATTDSDTLNYTMTDLTPGETYWFTVRATRTVNGKSYNGAFEKKSAKVNIIVPNVTGFKVTSNAEKSVTLSWNKVNVATGYTVYQKKDGKWVKVSSPKTTSLTVSNLKAGTTYQFAVKAFNKENDILITSEQYPTVTTSTQPAKVTGFKVSSTSANAIKLSWSKATGASGYTVYQKKSGKWDKVKSLTGTSLTVSSLKAGTTYQFGVKAYRKVNNSTYTSENQATLTTSTNPAKVNFTLTAGSRKVAIKWSKVTGATGYIAYMKTSANGKWAKIATTKYLSLTKVGLTTGKTYWFTVKAYRTVNGKTFNGIFATKSVKVK